MKTVTTYFFLAVVMLLTTQCKMQQMKLRVLYPPMVTLPEHVHKIAVINRTYPENSDKAINVIESVLSGEAIHGDKLASEDCIQAFNNEMNSSGVYQSIVPANHIVKRKLQIVVPDPLSREEVQKLCRDNNADALASLEMFDTNSKLISPELKITPPNPNNNTPPVYHNNYSISYYWRMYDANSNNLLDEDENQLKAVYNTSGPAEILPTGEIRKHGTSIGRDYAWRFLTRSYWEPREYFKKGNNDFKTACRKATVNDWEGAVEIWSKYTSSTNSKIAGRACYNMAIGCEVLGKIDIAKTWAQKAYSDYNVKQAREYMNVLERRPVLN